MKNATLQDSLDQFVKGELLEGDTAYYCEKCQAKVRISFGVSIFYLSSTPTKNHAK